MSLVILDKTASAKLTRHGAPVLVCDESGLVLGHFVPATAPEQLNLQPQVSEEELDRRQSRKQGRTLAEIVADLEKQA